MTALLFASRRVAIVIVRPAGEPSRYTASTLPTLSTTAMVAVVFRACASNTACASTCSTSATESATPGFWQPPAQPPVGSVPTLLPPEPPPHPTCTTSAIAPTRAQRSHVAMPTLRPIEPMNALNPRKATNRRLPRSPLHFVAERPRSLRTARCSDVRRRTARCRVRRSPGARTPAKVRRRARIRRAASIARRDRPRTTRRDFRSAA